MADISSDADGNPTLTGSGTPDDLHTAVTTPADVYQYAIDLSNMANGDVIQFEVEVKVRSGSTAARVINQMFANAQSDPVWLTPPIPALHSIKAIMTQHEGTGRAIEWTRIQYAT